AAGFHGSAPHPVQKRSMISRRSPRTSDRKVHADCRWEWVVTHTAADTQEHSIGIPRSGLLGSSARQPDPGAIGEQLQNLTGNAGVEELVAASRGRSP